MFNCHHLVRIGVASLITLAVTACGGGGGGAEGAAAPERKATSIGEAITIAEATGQYPVLDRDSTVQGVDSNANGVRDDIENYIHALPDSPAQKAALMQLAAALNNTLTIDVENQLALDNASRTSFKGVHCLYSVYNADQASKKGQDLQKFTVNTLVRLEAYEKYNSALSGKTMKGPKGDTCDK